uniref:Uncharacterized protein n=1 Tax=Geladintestivirus 1 TaxID=3233133 RepID=A0AAU8MKB6_9CAUD
MGKKNKQLHLEETPITVVDKNGDSFNIHPSAIGNSNLEVTVPEIVVKGNKNKVKWNAAPYGYRSAFDGNAPGEFAGTLINGIPMTLDRLASMGYKVIDGKEHDIRPIQSTMSLFSPTRLAGTTKDAWNGKLTAPWSENNPGLTGNPYLDMAIDIGALKGLSKGASKVRNLDYSGKINRVIPERLLNYDLKDKLDDIYHELYSKYDYARYKVNSKVYDTIFKVKNKGTRNVLLDLYDYPLETFKARINGEYPITFAERKKYIKARRDAIQKGIQFNKDKEKKWLNDYGFFTNEEVISKANQIKDLNKKGIIDYDTRNQKIDELLAKEHFPFETKYTDVGDAIASRLGLSIYSTGMSKPDRVIIRRRGAASNLPTTPIRGGRFNLSGVSTHEFNHSLMRAAKYSGLKQSLSKYDNELGYYNVNLDNNDIATSPFIENMIENKKIIEDYNSRNVPIDERHIVKVWQNSPEEFQSEKAAADVMGIKDPIKFLANRFMLSEKQAKDRYDWLNKYNYKYGGKIK